MGDAMPLVVRREYIGFGDAAIYSTVGRMKSIINESASNPEIREWARKILANVAVNDKMGEARAIHDFVRDHVRYTRDPHGFEYIQTPPVLLSGIREYLEGRSARPIGDCDDMTVLSLSLLKSVGFPVVIKVVGFHSDISGRFSHVYGLVNVNGRWIPVDCVRPDKGLGWESSDHRRVLEVLV